MIFNDMLELTLTDKRNQLFSLLDELEDIKQLTKSNIDIKKLTRDSYGEEFNKGVHSGLQIAIIKIKKYIDDF